MEISILLVGIASVFIVPALFMLGYVYRERQHGETVRRNTAAVSFQRRAMTEMHQADLVTKDAAILVWQTNATTLGETLSEATTKLAKMTDRWRYADNYRKALVEKMLELDLWNFDIHGDSPAKMLELILICEAAKAVDPTVSKSAKNLHTRGVRKGAAMGRKQMAKLMQKSIDNQAATITEYDVALDKANVRIDTYVTAVRNVLNDKIALPGVRKALRSAISVECERLRAVFNKSEL